MELSYCELHSPLFINGKNLGLKLDPTKCGGLKMTYDKKAQELSVTWMGVTGIVPTTNIVVYIPVKEVK